MFMASLYYIKSIILYQANIDITKSIIQNLRKANFMIVFVDLKCTFSVYSVKHPMLFKELCLIWQWSVFNYLLLSMLHPMDVQPTTKNVH